MDDLLYAYWPTHRYAIDATFIATFGTAYRYAIHATQ
jgi:hypothetical protein